MERRNALRLHGGKDTMHGVSIKYKGPDYKMSGFFVVVIRYGALSGVENNAAFRNILMGIRTKFVFRNPEGMT